MKEQTQIPTGKVARASKFIQTGAKVGGNYLKHYTKKLFDPEMSREELDQSNAEDIYNSLSELKGSALKVAQMMSMDKNILPTAYQQKFTMAQYSAPPLSYPLVVKTFRQYFNSGPDALFDTFTKNAVNAASIGQVHKATKGDKTYAVKIQYPGVANSISSDLKIVRPFAMRLLNVSGADLDRYMGEVEEKLIEETDYELELTRGTDIAQKCAHIKGIFFANYYPEWSSRQILTMDWLDGHHLGEFLRLNPSQEIRNAIGQALWDFYHFQIHELRQVHADPHPGNFIMREDGTLGIIDFGCIKVIPEDFYTGYFSLLRKDVHTQPEEINRLYNELEFLSPKDTPREREVFMELFQAMTSLLGRPFHSEKFDFGQEAYFQEIFQIGEKFSQMKEIRNSSQARGSRHGLYVNRTYFGLYNLLHDLKAHINTTKPTWLM
ncbi:AarF/ABC1/UbiB kinase family protein [Cytophagales bacterium LB-30]|uniref:AarF/ABC1/UbiB kinase family protein n=1 Tax=Shiella aurantiaca TaxID=3058365 RepID=A0ABT8F1V7_9BACT|nr:AarF/ABC1/UbiB kinase family protein [Shiella aurantiaca]MDN4164229.1 AarF/ABC1/UbiB kinase family protein [Shiella aurantiaca]